MMQSIGKSYDKKKQSIGKSYRKMTQSIGMDRNARYEKESYGS